MTNSIKSKETKPLFLFDGGIHAREWASITTVVYLIDKVSWIKSEMQFNFILIICIISLIKFIKEYYKSNELVVKLLRKFEIHFIPVLNPDGFEFSRASRVIINAFILL